MTEAGMEMHKFLLSDPNLKYLAQPTRPDPIHTQLADVIRAARWVPEEHADDDQTSDDYTEDEYTDEENEVPKNKANKKKKNEEPVEMPKDGDSLDELARKLIELERIVSEDKSIAHATKYVAAPNQYQDALRNATMKMEPTELYAWNAFLNQRYLPPDIDWDNDRDPLPPPGNARRNAQRRADALNVLYLTKKADPTHAMFYTRKHVAHLPIVKAVARIISARKNLSGGTGTLNATQFADLQTINKILSVTGQIVAISPPGGQAALISSAQRTLGAKRDELREIMKRGTS